VSGHPSGPIAHALRTALLLGQHHRRPPRKSCSSPERVGARCGPMLLGLGDAARLHLWPILEQQHVGVLLVVAGASRCTYKYTLLSRHPQVYRVLLASASEMLRSVGSRLPTGGRVASRPPARAPPTLPFLSLTSPPSSGIISVGRARWGASGALYPQSAIAGSNSLSRGAHRDWRVPTVLRVGSHAAENCEPRQVRKEAAVSRRLRVTWGCLA